MEETLSHDADCDKRQKKGDENAIEDAASQPSLGSMDGQGKYSIRCISIAATGRLLIPVVGRTERLMNLTKKLNLQWQVRRETKRNITVNFDHQR
jgi:hypothetical protein